MILQQNHSVIPGLLCKNRRMIATAEQLLHEFESLPDGEKSIFARLISRRLPLPDSGEITDEELCAAGDALAAMFDEEESHDPQAR